MRKVAHLTVGGRPLCLCPCHDRFASEMLITCGYRSIADAKKAKAELQKHVANVKVVPLPCPAYGED